MGDIKTEHIRRLAIAIALMACLLTGCRDEIVKAEGTMNAAQRISLEGNIEQVYATRVNDSGFADGDGMGVYVVDYRGNVPGELQGKGNRGDNVKYTFREAENRWQAAYDLYWKDDRTHIDVYGYYPWGIPDDVRAYTFEVPKDQSKASDDKGMGGYEAGDFLWGKAADVAPTDRTIRLPMRHRMSSPRITLKEGSGFADGEWEQTEKEVVVLNTRRKSLIDLRNGQVTAQADVAAPSGILPLRQQTEWRAIVVPQTIGADTPLFSITVGGTAYRFRKEEAFTYKAGKMHTFTIQVNKKAEAGAYEFVLADEGIADWENDEASHDATMKEYLVIQSEPGKLQESLQAAKKDYRRVKNLKVTGKVNSADFYFMRDSMTMLEALNLKEVEIAERKSFVYGEEKTDPGNAIPRSAFYLKSTLTYLILPDRLREIKEHAFRETRLKGSLNIPEGVTRVEESAFAQCGNLTGTLTLPSTLTYIGGSAFARCGFACELKLPDRLTYIGYGAFLWCNGLYGNLLLPPHLSYLGGRAFDSCYNLTGNLIIPQSLTQIPPMAFYQCGFNGYLELHDGITAIGSQAFAAKFKGELVLPKNLRTISESAFSHFDYSARFSSIKFPSRLFMIDKQAFDSNYDLTGVLEFPSTLLSIGSEAFRNCIHITQLILPASLENIGTGAFANCFDIQSIICRATTPPYLGADAFNGISKDNFTLEVPEEAVELYRTAPGWREFKRIAVHHELVCRPAAFSALNATTTRMLVLNAESEWEVKSLPDWCSLSQLQGNKKTELTLTIRALPRGGGRRSGHIVFALKGKDYTHTCTVSQYDYTHDEDEAIILQKATRGSHGGIDLIFLGDGFDAETVARGEYLETMQEQVANFFSIEPYKTYRDYFNVYTAIALSPESGVGTVNTLRNTRFETTFTGSATMQCDDEALFRYALRFPTVTRQSLHRTLFVLTPYGTDFDGYCQLWKDGKAIAFCPPAARIALLRRAGGEGFGKLGDESVSYNGFISEEPEQLIRDAQALGWYENLSLSGKTQYAPWSHLITDDAYHTQVDMFEGAFGYSRGVFRSEAGSCMNGNIPYYNTISRESIVKRIKRYAGEVYSFDDFKRQDKMELPATSSTYHLYR